MDVEENVAPEAPPLQEAAARLSARATALFATRVELASVELAAARERLILSVLLVGAALGCALLALAVASFGVIAYFWDGARFTAIVVVALVYAIAAAIVWLRFGALRRNAPALLGSTLAALRRDVERMGAGSS